MSILKWIFVRAKGFGGCLSEIEVNTWVTASNVKEKQKTMNMRCDSIKLDLWVVCGLEDNGRTIKSTRSMWKTYTDGWRNHVTINGIIKASSSEKVRLNAKSDRARIMPPMIWEGPNEYK